MKAYHIGGVVLSIILFVITFFSCGISNSIETKGIKKEAQKIEESTVVVRYYDDTAEDSRVHYIRVQRGRHFTLEKLPSGGSVESVSFVGLYDSASVMYVDANGNSVRTLESDIVLYPKFQ